MQKGGGKIIGVKTVGRPDKTRQRRIRHLSMVSDAARAPYPTYGSDL
ncbi:hypothetical protein AKN40_3856 [Escherichia coli]|uniref:Uncharacterized protein n=1 Tax=Escherichia coli TaxID=562 RepID=A0A222AW66_ECOLX|nr:conserved hypothetical protein [Escherichia coli UMNK88]AKM33936.1 hypothetical protein PCN061_0385 [Escherichia coli PCN061]ASO80630.1 hypothetical protein AKN40_3856 [Escherichia coli]EDX38844.1 conserved hypothetical protein [Escherichia coli 101-1]EFQ02215.1 conserved hypothetical protein [Escherichia coli 1827-70]EFZ56825.1 hypothetical protein ECLT68_4500 [Escherichia coli LT-68]EGB58888.1 ribonucleoside diphosphage reductase 1 [Escherichia coli H489]EGB67568.1 ribonucleoside diphos